MKTSAKQKKNAIKAGRAPKRKTRPARRSPAKGISVKDVVRKIADKLTPGGKKKPDGKKSDGKKSDGKKSDGKKSDGKKSDGKKSDGKKRPFGGKGRRKKQPDVCISKEARNELDSIDIDKKLDAEAEQAVSESYSSLPGAANGFFYTDEKFINQFEDSEIAADIRSRHPEFMLRTNNDMRTRKAIVNVLEDEDFMVWLLGKYQMDIMDFFRFLFRQEQSIFKTPFIRRVQQAVKGRKYNA